MILSVYESRVYWLMKKIQLNQIGLLFTRKNLVYNEVVVYPHSGLCALCFYILLLSQSVIAHRECTYVKIYNIYQKWCVHIISNKLNLLVLIKLINLISAKGFYKLKVNRIVISYFCFLAFVGVLWMERCLNYSNRHF